MTPQPPRAVRRKSETVRKTRRVVVTLEMDVPRQYRLGDLENPLWWGLFWAINTDGVAILQASANVIRSNPRTVAEARAIMHKSDRLADSLRAKRSVRPAAATRGRK